MYAVLGLCLAALIFLAIVKNKVDNRRINRHNRNVDRQNELIEKLQQQKENNKEDEN
jgi:ribosomal protein L13E